MSDSSTERLSPPTKSQPGQVPVTLSYLLKQFGGYLRSEVSSFSYYVPGMPEPVVHADDKQGTALICFEKAAAKVFGTKICPVNQRPNALPKETGLTLEGLLHSLSLYGRLSAISAKVSSFEEYCEEGDACKRVSANTTGQEKLLARNGYTQVAGSNIWTKGLLQTDFKSEAEALHVHLSALKTVEHTEQIKDTTAAVRTDEPRPPIVWDPANPYDFLQKHLAKAPIGYTTVQVGPEGLARATKKAAEIPDALRRKILNATPEGAYTPIKFFFHWRQNLRNRGMAELDDETLCSILVKFRGAVSVEGDQIVRARKG